MLLFNIYQSYKFVFSTFGSPTFAEKEPTFRRCPEIDKSGDVCTHVYLFYPLMKDVNPRFRILSSDRDDAPQAGVWTSLRDVDLVPSEVPLEDAQERRQAHIAKIAGGEAMVDMSNLAQASVRAIRRAPPVPSRSDAVADSDSDSVSDDEQVEMLDSTLGRGEKSDASIGAFRFLTLPRILPMSGLLATWAVMHLL